MTTTYFKATLFAAAMTLALAGCGGGGTTSGPGDTGSSGGSSDGSGGTTDKTTTSGVFKGTVTSTTTGGTTTMVGLTAPNGHSVWMTTDGRVFDGTLPTSGTGFDAHMAGYMYPASHFPDGGNYGPSTMHMGYGGGTWSGTYAGNGDAGSFAMGMSAMWSRPASLATLAGTYTRTTSVGYTMTMSIAASGEFTASDSRGCLVNGTVTVPDAVHNLYQLDATVTSCGALDGAYHGYGSLLDADAMRDWSQQMGCFQYGSGGMMGGGGMGGGMMGGWWPLTGTNTVPGGTQNLFMFSMVNGHYAIMDALAR
jgi:hypothetical protein